MAKKVIKPAFAYVKGEALGALIDSIEQRAKGIKWDIHVACMSSALHVLEHGNTTPINKLVEVCASVTHNNAVARWFAEYCQWVKWDTKEKQFVLKHVVRKAVLLEDGTADPKVIAEYTKTLAGAKTYYDLTKAPVFNGVNVIALLKAIERKVEKAQTEADEVEATDPAEAAAMRAKIDTRGLAEVKALAEKLAA